MTGSRLALSLDGEQVCVDQQGHLWKVLDGREFGLLPVPGRLPTPEEERQAAKHAPLYQAQGAWGHRPRRHG